MSSANGESGAFDGAQLRVVRGDPDDVELVALVAGIVAARTPSQDDESDGGTPPWGDLGRRLGHRRPGPSTWRWSLHP